MVRYDETWHRLLRWTTGQTPSERLAHQILLNDGYSRLDPSHPLGGRDGGKDAVCYRGVDQWIMAAYFPPNQQAFKDIKSKFAGDLKGAVKNQAVGMAFVTNQPLTIGEKKTLEKLAQTSKLDTDIFSLERLVTILDTAAMASTRQQFLDIPGVPVGVPPTPQDLQDVSLFQRLLVALPSDGETMRLFVDQNFGARFRYARLNALYEFQSKWGNAQHTFHDAKVEAQRIELLQAMEAFTCKFSQHCVLSEGSKPEFASIGMDDYETRPEMFVVAEDLNGLAGAVWTAHQALIRLARASLPVTS